MDTVEAFSMDLNGRTYKVAIQRRDQYNDYSVAYDWYVTTNNGNGRTLTYPMYGERQATKMYREAIALLRQRACKFPNFHVVG